MATRQRTPADRARAAQPPRVQGARLLMLIAALVAATASAVSIVGLGAHGPDAVVVETWRAYGLLVFAGLFAILAWRPLEYRGVWELVIAHKVALTLTVLFLVSGDGPGAADAATVLAWDGGLSVVLLVSYVSCRAWRSWR